jgi:hypothetical protein
MTMQELIDSHNLGAFDAQNIRLMGMPNVGADYKTGEKKARHSLRQDAICCGCGRPANQGHHLVPKGMGGGRRVYYRQTDWGIFPLLSPVFAVCGMGNSSGCHGKFHHQGGLIEAKWVWDGDEAFNLWDTGKLWRRCKPNSDLIYQFGRWEISDGEKSWEVRNWQ